jgi:hypothetical protein
MPELLRGVNSKVDLDLLGVRPRYSKAPDRPAYREDGFTWVPPDGPFDLRSQAYREIQRSDMTAETKSLDAVGLLNMLIVYTVPIRRAAVDVNFRQ